jgi:hypothetical protein
MLVLNHFPLFISVFVPSLLSESLDLGNNFLDGQIPDTIGNIHTLQELRLNNNLLRGGIPISFGNLISLGK